MRSGLRKSRMSCVMDWKWMKMICRMAVKMAMRRGCGELGRMSCDGLVVDEDDW